MLYILYYIFSHTCICMYICIYLSPVLKAVIGDVQKGMADIDDTKQAYHLYVHVHRGVRVSLELLMSPCA